MNKNKMIEVCSECYTASCWYGEFLCQKAGGAGTIILPIGVLELLNLESSDYWGDVKLVEVYGTLDPHPAEEYVRHSAFGAIFMNQLETKVVEMCVNIFAHAENDREIALGGNGTNSAEAANVAKEILRILKIDRKDLQQQIDTKSRVIALGL